MAYRRFYRSKKGSRKPRAYKKRTAPKVKFVKRVVKQVLSRNMETKIKEYAFSDNLLPYAVSALYTNSVIPITPYPSYLSIDQGVGQAQRIGNTIRTKRLVLRGYIAPVAYHATINPNPRPVIVKLVFCTSKDNRTTLDTTSLGNFFQYNNSYQSPSGNMFDMVRSFNTDSWIIHKVLTFKVAPAVCNGTGANAAAQNFANNDFKYSNNFTIDLTKYCSKILKFEDTIGYPMNPIIQMVPLVACPNDSTFGAAEVPAALTYNITYTYTDA